jgi:hypothetical protein
MLQVRFIEVARKLLDQAKPKGDPTSNRRVIANQDARVWFILMQGYFRATEHLALVKAIMETRRTVGNSWGEDRARAITEYLPSALELKQFPDIILPQLDKDCPRSNLINYNRTLLDKELMILLVHLYEPLGAEAFADEYDVLIACQGIKKNASHQEQADYIEAHLPKAA